MPPNKSPGKIERGVRQRLLRRFRSAFAVPPKRIVVGFSGGSDSLALALVLKGAARALRVPIELIYVDHRLRPDSAVDAERARQLAARIELPIVIVAVTDDPRVLHPGVGVEEAARRERFATFAGELRDGDVLALAHHASDQAETLLLHLLRGAGLRGMAGMAELGSLTVPWWNRDQPQITLPIWRPFLQESRADVRAILVGTGLLPIEDPSNRDRTLRRNAIRLGVLPEISAIEPDFERHFGDFATIARDEHYLLDRLSAEAETAVLTGDGVRAVRLSSLPVALARRVLSRWLSGDGAEPPTFDRVEAVRRFARADDFEGMIEIAGDAVVGNLAGTLIRGTRDELKLAAWQASGLLLPLASMGDSIQIDGDRVVARAPVAQRVVVIFSLADNLSGTITVERIADSWRRSGERDEWQSWFRERRISPWIRGDVLGVALDGVPFWIPMQSDQPAESTGRFIQVEVIPE